MINGVKQKCWILLLNQNSVNDDFISHKHVTCIIYQYTQFLFNLYFF